MMLQQKLSRRWRNVFDLVVATSEAVRQRLTQEGIDVAAVISEAIPRRPTCPLLPSPPTVAFAGRLVREKGVDLLLRAFAVVVQQIPNARLLIAGDGPERENLRRLTAELNITSSVHLLGQLSQTEMEGTLWLHGYRWCHPVERSRLG